MASNADKPRVHMYTRASTDKQAESPETHMEINRKYADFQLRGLETYAYVDAATSGDVPLLQRRDGKKMCRSLRKGDHIVIAKLDRAFRSLLDCAQMVAIWRGSGVTLHIVNMCGMSIDLSSPIGRLLVMLLAAFAEFERALVRERTKEGMENAKANGRRVTLHPEPGFAFKKTGEIKQSTGRPRYKIVPNHEEQAFLRKIVAWIEHPPQSSLTEVSRFLIETGATFRNLGITAKWTAWRVALLHNHARKHGFKPTEQDLANLEPIRIYAVVDEAIDIDIDEE